MGSGGGGNETSRADGETNGPPGDVLVGGGDFSELPLGLEPLGDMRSPLVLILALFRLKSPMLFRFF